MSCADSTDVRPETTVHEVRVPGRVLCVHETGAGDGPAILFHHGTPGPGIPMPAWAQDAAERGVRLIGYSRPGYARSTPHPGRTVVDAGTDAAAIMDALGIERFLTWGVSGGGPHALACAAVLPDRVVAVASVAGVAPFRAHGLNYFDGMGDDNLIEFGLAMAGRERLEPFCTAAAEQMLATGPDGILEAMASLVSPPDRAVLTGELAETMAAEMPITFASGVQGWIDDDFAFLAPFGFQLSAIASPALIVHGRQDRFVPVEHGEWLAQEIPGAEAWISPEEGHLTLSAHGIPAVHEWLLGRL